MVGSAAPAACASSTFGFTRFRDGIVGRPSTLLAHHFARRFVGADSEQPRVAKLAVHGPLDEPALHDDLGLDPVRAHARESYGFGERRRFHLEAVPLLPEVEQHARVAAGADLTGEDEVVTLVVADEQRAEADAGPLRVGEPAHHELLRGLAFHLQPLLRAAVLVDRVAPLRDDSFPPLRARLLPRARAYQLGHPSDRRLER